MSTTKKDSAYWSALAVKAVDDPDALTELYEHFFPSVYQYLLGKTHDNSLTDDLVSDTFVRMYEHLEQYDPSRGAFSTWLFRISINVMTKHYTGKAYTTTEALEDDYDVVDTGQETPEEKTLSDERNAALKAAMMKLSERERKILEMSYWLGMKSGEIGEALGMTAGAVRVAETRAKEKLRSLLAD